MDLSSSKTDLQLSFATSARCSQFEQEKESRPPSVFQTNEKKSNLSNYKVPIIMILIGVSLILFALTFHFIQRNESSNQNNNENHEHLPPIDPPEHSLKSLQPSNSAQYGRSLAPSSNSQLSLPPESAVGGLTNNPQYRSLTTGEPTNNPNPPQLPSNNPSNILPNNPSKNPSNYISNKPSNNPSNGPSDYPSNYPSFPQSDYPTGYPKSNSPSNPGLDKGWGTKFGKSHAYGPTFESTIPSDNAVVTGVRLFTCPRCIQFAIQFQFDNVWDDKKGVTQATLDETKELILNSGEYINGITISVNDNDIYYLKISTADGREISVGIKDLYSNGDTNEGGNNWKLIGCSGVTNGIFTHIKQIRFLWIK